MELLTDTEAVDRGLLVGELDTERERVPVGETDIVLDLVDEPVNVPVPDPEAVSVRDTDGLREDDVLPDGLRVSEDEDDGDSVGDGLCVALEDPVEDPESLTLPVELADELELCVDVAEAEDDLVALELSEALEVDDSRDDTVAEAVPDVEPVAVAVADDDCEVLTELVLVIVGEDEDDADWEGVDDVDPDPRLVGEFVDEDVEEKDAPDDAVIVSALEYDADGDPVSVKITVSVAVEEMELSEDCV